MSKKLRVLALVMTALMLVSVFAGCKKEVVNGSSGVMTESEVGNTGGNVDAEDESGVTTDTESKKDNESKKDTASKKDETASKTTSSKKTTTSNKITVNKEGWPIVNEKLKMEVMGVTRPDYANPKDMSFFKYYNDLTNIDLVYTGITEGTINERKTLALQSGDVPAAFKFNHNSFTDYELYKYGDEGMFVDLKSDIKKYAPNVQKLLSDGVISALNTNPEGKIYTLPTRRVADVDYQSHYLNINKTWLDHLGLDIPETVSEFENVMEQFKANAGDGVIPEDVVPFAIWQFSAKFVYAFFGIHMEDKTGIGLDQNGKAYYAHAITNSEAALKFWNGFYKKDGMMAKEIMNKGEGFWSAFQNQVKKGNVGCFWWSYMSYMNKDLMKDYVAIPYPSYKVQNANYKLAGSAQPYNSVPTKGSMVITKKCPSVGALLRYMDYLYTDDGVMLANYGPESAGLYKKLSNGNYELTAKGTVANSKKEGPGGTLGLGTGVISKSKIIDKNNKTDAWISEYEAAANKTYKEANEKNKVVYFTDFQKKSSEIVALRKFEYFYDKGGFASNFVTGGTGYDINNYTTWVSDLEQKGLKQYVKVYQGIVDRNKKYIL